ncbi:hypothetical protein SUGI_0309270 [Cryptomeria japonica]|uniref:uncharacterized protein LOC131075888 n=1 Tax=Cryptomeria japonica TaxID=3369 RepID=UPI002408E9F0|nr:uncharacterized protein LOC131075888 [Cryptomeria japonica]GLJ17720.1 hypothetical protein SUGI_0309270 [Cryptomeria japonica]
MAAPSLSTPFQPYVYQSPQAAVTPFQILGGEAQIVQIMLKPQEKVLAKAGTMCYMSGSIQMENVLPPENNGGGMWQWVFGKSVANTEFINGGSQDGFVGVAAPSLSRILPIDLATFNGEIICQPDSFICSVNDVTVTTMVNRRARPGIFGGEGILRQKLVGRGLAFIAAGGSVVQKNLAPGEALVVDAACIVAMTSTIDFHVKNATSARRPVFGGDGLFTAHLTGPGIVFIQSLPFYRLSQRIARAVTSPNVRDNPRFFVQIGIFFFLAYIMIVSSLLLTDV